MNWLLIVILALIVGNVIWGLKLGFMRVALSLVSWVLVLVACYTVTPVVADAIMEHTPLAEVIQNTVNENLDDVLGNVVGGAIDNSALGEIEAKLPAQIKDVLLGEHESLEDLLVSQSGKLQIDTTQMARTAANLIGTFIVLIVTRIILFVLDKILGLASKLPLIGQADKSLGLVAGAVKGLIWCWLVLGVIAVLTMTGTNTELIQLVNESPILLWLYENNIIVNVLMGSM